MMLTTVILESDRDTVSVWRSSVLTWIERWDGKKKTHNDPTPNMLNT